MRLPLRFRIAALLAVAVAMPAFAHVGSPNVFFDGNAGPYPIRVVVKQPGVVPGLADITVRTPADASHVAVKPVKWDIGEAGSPPADAAARIAGDANAWTASLWLMSRGSYSIYVDVDGAKGRGRAIVPVTAVATKRLPMPKFLSFLLAGMGALLVIGAISLMGAGAREAVLEPGLAVDTVHRRNGRIALGAGTLIVLLLVARGNAWWNEVDTEYRKLLFKPLHITTSVDRAGVLDLVIDDPEWRQHAQRFTPLMPDHGKLMHLFLIREDGKEAGSAMAHLHPQMPARDHFRAAVPPLPPGSYRLFADVTHESGFAQTLVDRVTVTAAAPAASALSDPDDAAWTASPSPAGSSPVVMLSPLSVPANRDTDLRFRMPGVLEPYMGMPGHAVIVSDDFSVFVHLHPMGSVSMASQMKFAERDKLPHDMGAMNAPATTAGNDGTVSFPYAFPKRGRYHVWVQSKVNGQIVTGAFVVEAK